MLSPSHGSVMPSQMLVGSTESKHNVIRLSNDVWKERQAKWDHYFMGNAEAVSLASKDPSTKVGCVITDSDYRIVSTGFNGFPRGIKDTEERLNNRELKYKLILHSEPNAILFAHRDLRNCTIYTWPFMPCSSCALLIIQSGITRVVAPYVDNSRWEESFKLTKELFEEANIELTLLDWQSSESRDSKDSERYSVGHVLGSI